jgi:hypothetical protein
MVRGKSMFEVPQPFVEDFAQGFAGPFQLLSLRRIRKGEIWRLNGLLVGATADFTRLDSIRFRWMWWWNSIPAKCVQRARTQD